MQNLTITQIIVCSRCGGLLLAQVEQKTRTCPHCGSKIQVEKVKKIASAKDAYEASKLLQELKENRATKQRKPSLE